MSGYLTVWRFKPDTPAGRVLKVISEAGDHYHHTEGWSDSNPYDDDDETTQMDIIEECVELECGLLEAKLAEYRELVKQLLYGHECRDSEGCRFCMAFDEFEATTPTAEEESSG